MLYLAYDTETTGLPLSQACDDFYDTLNWPRVYQIGAILFDEQGFEFGRMNRLIRPNGWVIPKVDQFLLDLGQKDFHAEVGITTERLMDEGISLGDAIREFNELANQCDEKVCHNAGFDFPVITCEMFRVRHFPKNWVQKPQHCTKLLTENLLQIPSGIPGKFKWPSLQEAYTYCYGKPFDGAHDAMSDVQATMDVFLDIQYLL